MFCRERLIKTLKFEPIDRIPLIEWPVRTSTMREWIKQGYPEGIVPEVFFNLDTSYLNVPIDVGMYPLFEEKILEQDENYKIWQDSLGAIRKDFLKDATPGFVTRSWLRFPVSEYGFLY